VFVNSGSRTDHGEVQSNNNAFTDAREVPLTSAILRIPANAQDLQLPNDETALKPYLFADGTRNAYALEFAPNGDLFATDNGPDADYPDELNWIREGLHYGFPWRFGNQDNPQQFADYDSSKDVRLSLDFIAVRNLKGCQLAQRTGMNCTSGTLPRCN
jgi:glucose/arabinose dehydrogenase